MLLSKFQEEIFPILPENAGCYLMKDEKEQIIYVGKAKNIKNRVSSYFHGKKEIKTALLVKAIHSIDFILTDSEQEALLLENNLIKKHKPKYNIDLKDGKTYPCIKITKEDFPRIYKTRQITHDGALYFGPYTDAGMLETYLNLIYQLYPIRRCKNRLTAKKAPCLYYHLKQCEGACIGGVSSTHYQKMIEEIILLIKGDDDHLVKILQEKMQACASLQEFEKAAKYRDALKSIEVLKQKQNIIDFNPEIRDYVSFLLEEETLIFSVFQMREGRMSGRDLITFQPCFDLEDSIRQFLIQYYEQYHEPPNQIFIQSPFPLDSIIAFIEKNHRCTIQWIDPQEAKDLSIINMGLENCRHEMIRTKRLEGEMPALQELKQVLMLKQLPTHIEGFDIAQLHGKNTVASLIVFKNGKPDNANYRSFNIKTLKGKIDDFEAIREAVARRYSRLINEKKPLPQLILIDGGEGQVNAASQIIEALNLSIPIVGLAKREEWLYLPHNPNPIILPKGNDALRILQAVRDETHRLATTKSRKQRNQSLTFQQLESIPGIGHKRALALLEQFGSIENLSKQTPKILLEQSHIPLKLGEKLLVAIQNQS